MNFKNIHIGSLIHEQVADCELEMSRICNFFKHSEKEIEAMYISANISAEALLKWSKILKYDFFRLYSHHLILYCPPSIIENNIKKQKSALPAFRKNIYTKEIIDFILDLIKSGEKTKQQIINEYRIPKTTLYKWIEKYQP
ncbi:transposase [Chryseobacterium sp. MIQD13]|uniref:transposase n=1 Tax=Chryseobacterium sp. MIQD13 TaxID=3422310 RepID=UPI003D2DAA2C